MSDYSLDSLEGVEEDSLEKIVPANDEDEGYACNLRAENFAEEFADQFHSDSMLISWTRDIPRYSRLIRSPEGSTLSICGDSQLEELSSDEGCSSLPGTSRDDGSELSFYRRFVEGHVELATRTSLSRTMVSDRELPNNTVLPGVTKAKAYELGVAEGKPREPTYRPYTIEEYRSLSVPRPDRSLGPDKEEVRMKREWLMRQRSYGDSVSARNLEQILHRARRRKGEENSRLAEMNATRESLSKRPVRRPTERPTPSKTSLSGSGRTLEKTSNSGRSSLVSRAAVHEDPYLETLRQRHSEEKELVDRLMRQVLGSRSRSGKVGRHGKGRKGESGRCENF